MIEGVKIIRTINEKAIEFSYNGIVFGMSKEEFKNMTQEGLDRYVQEVNKRSERLNRYSKIEKERYNKMTSKEQKDYDKSKSALFERWNEYDDEE